MVLKLFMRSAQGLVLLPGEALEVLEELGFHLMEGPRNIFRELLKDAEGLGADSTELPALLTQYDDEALHTLMTDLGGPGVPTQLAFS